MLFKIYYEGRLVLYDLDIDIVQEMYKRGWLKIRADGDYDLKPNQEHKHLFNRKIPFGKRLGYFERINQMKCACEDCGKTPSLHIRPEIDENGVVNFKKIICVCKECRTKKLKQQDILIPQFKKNFSNKALDREIKNELHNKYKNNTIVYKLMNNERFIRMKRKEKRMYSLTKIPLPPMPKMPKRRRSKEQEERMLRRIGIESMTTELNLEEKEVRIKVRKFLSYESFNLCPCCGRRTEYRFYTIDHIHPKSKGGPNTIENFIGMCKDCNKSKGNFTVLEYLQRRHFKALPERVLKVAYREQERVKEEFKEFKQQVDNYEEELVKEAIA